MLVLGFWRLRKCKGYCCNARVKGDYRRFFLVEIKVFSYEEEEILFLEKTMRPFSLIFVVSFLMKIFHCPPPTRKETLRVLSRGQDVP